MFVSPAFSTPTRPMTSPQASPFTPKTNFNKVDLSASPAQQQRQGVSSKKAAAMEEAWGVLSKEIEGSQLLQDMPFHEGLDVGVRLRSLDSMITTLQGLRDSLDGYFNFLDRDGRGIDAIWNINLFRFYEDWTSAERGLEPTDTYDPFLQLIEEREKSTFNSLALAQRFKDLSYNVNAVLRHLTEREKSLRNSAYHDNQASRQAIVDAIRAKGATG
jgi:hypothetical protein